MTVLPIQPNPFPTDEWHRLNELALKYEPRMRTGYLRAARSGVSLDKLQLRKVIIDLLVETCVTSSHVYDLVFNPNSPRYIETIDALVEQYAGFVDVPAAKDAVRRILPKDIELHERGRRLNTFGLDTRSAVQVERYRQDVHSPTSVERLRRSLIVSRGNRLATTETNRAINQSLEALWMDNTEVSKAEVIYYDRSISDINNLPRKARKEWITRRDDRVCNYCFPLEGIRAKLGEDFDTDYGYFATPPIHPLCRCFLIIGV